METDVFPLMFEGTSNIANEREKIGFTSSPLYQGFYSNNLIVDTFSMPTKRRWLFDSNVLRLNESQRTATTNLFSRGAVEITTLQYLRQTSSIFSNRIFEIVSGFDSPVQIPQQLVEIADESALNLLSTERQLIPVSARMMQSVATELTKLHLYADYILTTFADPEAEETTNRTTNLQLEVTIRDKTYSEILEIWDRLSRLMVDLPVEMQKKMSIVVDEA